jgi:hypothetical protein
MVKELIAGNGKLVLRAEDAGWCRVALVFESRTLALGADRLDVISKKLSAGLGELPEGPSAGRIQGVDARWILSLNEEHASLYVGQGSGRWLLFVQGADGSLLGRLELTESDRERWLRELA